MSYFCIGPGRTAGCPLSINLATIDLTLDDLQAVASTIGHRYCTFCESGRLVIANLADDDDTSGVLVNYYTRDLDDPIPLPSY